MKNPIAWVLVCVQQMMMCLQRLPLLVTYVPGKDPFLGDTLSRSYAQDQHGKELLDDKEVIVHPVIQEILASPVKLEKFPRAAVDYTTLQQLQ